MFTLAFILVQADPLITFECAGRPLKEVFAKLEPTIGHKVYVSAELAEQPVVILAKNRPWSAVQKDLAWCFRATWKNETLGRTDEDNKARIEAARLERETDIANYLAGVKRKTESWGKWTDSELKALVARGIGLYDDENPRTVVTQASLELLTTLGAKAISLLPKGSYLAYPPQKGERAFPTNCLPIVREALENERKLRTYFLNPPKETPTQALLHFNDGMYTFVLADDRGRAISTVYQNEFVEPVPQKADGSDKPIELSSLSQEIIALRRAARGTPLAASNEAREAINNPLKVDPTELLTGDILLAIARVEGRQIVASPSFLGTSRFAARIRLPITSRQATAELMVSTEFERTEGSMRVRSKPAYGLAAPRSKLQEVANKIQRAKTSQEIADALFTTLVWPPEHYTEVLIPQRLLNGSIEATSSPGDLRPFLVTPVGSRRVVAMTTPMRAVIEKLFREDSDSLWVDRKMSSAPPNLEAPPDMAPRDTYSVSGLMDFSALPLRAFPNGPPNEIEIEILAPGQRRDNDSPLRLFMGVTADRSLAKRTYYHDYGNMLRDFRSGARKDMPAYFWSYGESGGTVKIRFPGGYWIAIAASATAIHPDEKARPISELPAEFVRQAEEYSKLEITRGAPPPGK